MLKLYYFTSYILAKEANKIWHCNIQL